MIGFIVRRILVSILTLVVASYLMYNLAANSGNPLADIQGTGAINEQQLIATRVEALSLDVPSWLRWFGWFGGVLTCVVPFAGCDLGQNLSYVDVTTILPTAMVSTVQLVTASTILAIILGVTIGIVTALRQYSGFDVSITFLSFFLYSLPSFLVAVLLKEFIAIGFNDFLADPVIPPLSVAVIAVVAGFIWQVLVGGDVKRRLIVFGVSAAATATVLVVMEATSFFTQPALGPVGLPLIIAGVVVIVTLLVAGFENKRALLAAGITGALAYAAYFSLQWLFDISTPATIAILAVATIAVSLLVGFLVGGPDKAQVIRAAVITGVLSAGFVLLDRFMQAWPDYISHNRIRGRPVATAQGTTPGFDADMWGLGIDNLMHYMLPTIALLLISFAGYTRYARAGMLEVMNQDYIRTARAKGLPERTVVMRHAFRNMLIPITTIVAADVGALLGGAIITERVFAISGMGSLFATSLGRVDLNPLMGYFLIIAIMAILFNFLADLSYAALDPRVRAK